MQTDRAEEEREREEREKTARVYVKTTGSGGGKKGESGRRLTRTVG